MIYRVVSDENSIPRNIYEEKTWAARPNISSSHAQEESRTISSFLKAIETENIDLIKEMLKANRVDINSSNFMHRTPLYVSLRKIEEKLKITLSRKKQFIISIDHIQQIFFK